MKRFTYLVLFGVALFCPVSRAQTTFDYTGTVQTYTVPACAGSITVDIKGAEGGMAAASVGGKGGRVQATLSVIPGEVLNIYVGGNVVAAEAAGWNGGGAAGTAGAAGAGASDIRRGTDLSGRIIVAAGGGGAGFPAACGNNTQGGDGGGLNGKDGWRCGGHDPYYNGLGGTQTAGGAACTYGQGSTAGDLGTGGAGGNQGGGGGAGYYGGGGGSFGGGGGGSSYTDVTATTIVHTAAFQTGSGQVVITPVNGASAPGPIYGTNSACSGLITTYSVDSVSGITSYNWTFPEGTTINSGQGTTSVRVTTGNASGKISVTATNSCGVSPPRELNFTYLTSLDAYAGTDTSICEGDSVRLTASGGTNYSWSPAEGLSCSNCPSPMASPSATTTYSVTVTSGSCDPSTDSVLVTVNDCGETGIKKLSDESELSIFPNPAADVLHLQLKAVVLKQVNVVMMNVQGQVVYSGTIHVGPIKEVDISSLPKGFYYLRAMSEGLFVVRKIVIQ